MIESDGHLCNQFFIILYYYNNFVKITYLNLNYKSAKKYEIHIITTEKWINFENAYYCLSSFIIV